MYTVKNFGTKKALKEAVARGEKIRIYAPGLGSPKENGTEYLEGPHYPEPHRWYAQVEMRDGVVVKVKNPGTNWHVDRAERLREHAQMPISGQAKLQLRELAGENDFAAQASRDRGMNPTILVNPKGTCPICHEGQLNKGRKYISCPVCRVSWKTKSGRLHRNPFFLQVGRKWEDWKTGKKTYQGSSQSVSTLPFKSAKDAHDVAKIAGVNSYMIEEEPEGGGGRSEVVFRTPDIKRYEASKVTEQMSEDSKRQKRIAVLKQTIKKTGLWKSGSTEVYAERSDVEYRPSYSRRIIMSTYLWLKLPGQAGDRPGLNTFDIDPGNFYTKSGAFRKKQFLDDLARRFSGGRSSERAVPSKYNRYLRTTFKGRPAVPGKYPATLLKLAEVYPDIARRYEDLKKGLWSTSY